MNNIKRTRIKFKDCIYLTGESCKRFDKEKKYISTGCVQNNRIDNKQIELVTYDNKPSRANVIVSENDLIFAKMQGTIKVLEIDSELSNNIYSTGFFSIKANEQYISKRCLYHLLNSKTFNRKKDQECKGATQKALNNEGLSKIVISISPIESQSLIAKELDKLQVIIDKYNDELDYLDQLVKGRFVEMFGDPSTNSKGYPIKLLPEIAEYWNGLTYKPGDVSDEGTMVLRSSNIQNGELDFNDTVRVVCKIGERKFVQDNDILMCSRNGSARLVGKVALIKNINEPMSFGAFMMIIRSSYFSYLMTYFQMPAFRSQITTGATTTINQITGRMLDNIRLPIPDIEVVNQFADFVQQVDKSRFISLHYNERIKRK